MKTSTLVLIVIGVAILAIIVGGAAGYFVARNQFSSSNIMWKTAVFDRGVEISGPDIMTRSWRSRMNPGMMDRMDRFTEKNQPRLQFMLDACAEALDMTSDEMKDKLKSGKSMWDLASDKGIASEDFDQFMIDAATKALDKMVADGDMTQKQADAMLESIQENWQNVDPETCPCIEGFGSQNRMWRWYTP